MVTVYLYFKGAADVDVPHNGRRGRRRALLLRRRGLCHQHVQGAQEAGGLREEGQGGNSIGLFRRPNLDLGTTVLNRYFKFVIFLHFCCAYVLQHNRNATETQENHEPEIPILDIDSMC